MLELMLVKESLFHNVLEAILDLADTASVDCSRTGLKLQTADTESIAIIMLFFPAEDFQHYHCDEVLSMGIAIADMVKAIRCAGKDDTITIKIGDANIETITLSFESPNGNSTTDYDLPLVDANIQRFHIPDWQALDSKYQAFVQMPSAEFMRACKHLSNVNDDSPVVGNISVTEEGLELFAFGNNGFVNIKYMQPKEGTAATLVTMRAPVSLILDLKYMNSLAKASTLFNQVKICLSATQPLMVECKIGQMGYIRHFLAPIIDIKEEEVKKEEIKNRKEKEIADRRGTAKTKGAERKRKGAKRSKGAERGKGRERRDQRERRGQGSKVPNNPPL